MREHIILGLPGDAMAAVNKHYAIGFPAAGVYIVHMQCIFVFILMSALPRASNIRNDLLSRVCHRMSTLTRS